MTSATLGGSTLGLMTGLTRLVRGILEATQFLVSHGLVMTGTTFSFLASYVRLRGAIGVMTSRTFLAILMGLMRKIRRFFAGITQGHLGGYNLTCHTNAGNGAGEGKGESSGTDNHLFHLFPLSKL